MKEICRQCQDYIDCGAICKRKGGKTIASNTPACPAFRWRPEEYLAYLGQVSIKRAPVASVWYLHVQSDGRSKKHWEWRSQGPGLEELLRRAIDPAKGEALKAGRFAK